MNDKILGAIGQDTPYEKNIKVPETDGTFISQDANGMQLNTYNKVVTDSGRVPVIGDDTKTVQTITITRTLISEN